ncbi:vWA domain-containing protein [Bordetella genomosp. 13]|uniref:vWA domain-containing protein n=1 Tax=Bordetella genomosp. 13 TaxID=463040 RepID=UPI00119C9111|nr:VWA domain-containing protein [Bordetella genomosp. 13]
MTVPSRSVRFVCTTLMAALLAACNQSGTPSSGGPASNMPSAGTPASGASPASQPRPAAQAPSRAAPMPAPGAQLEQRAAAAAPQPLIEPAAPPPPRPAPASAAQRMRMESKVAAYAPAADSVAPDLLPAVEDHENYSAYKDNPVHLAAEQPVSTFGVDVDTGSYSNVRRLLNEGRLPPQDAVRSEAFINYFDYGYTVPDKREQPFSVTTELAPAPWNPKRQLLLVGIQGYEVAPEAIPASNLVLLVDTSGSMADKNKLPLLKAALRQLVDKLRPEDRVAIVTYAGSAGVALPSTSAREKARILAAIDGLRAAGSTNGSAGLDLAYAQAAQGYVRNGVNRILLASDGDFNVGTVDLQALKDKIGAQRKRGIALTTLGVGSGNYNDALAMQLADAGNGSYHYLDNLAEARKVLSREMSATLLTIAGDVKVQVEFNPAAVADYRLIGYEKRALAREDFNNDSVDAGEIGAGASVTALYEITPVGAEQPRVEPLRYGAAQGAPGAEMPALGSGAKPRGASEVAYLRLRYKLPGQDQSKLVEQAVSADASAAPSERLQRAASAAAFAQWLRGGKYLDGYTPAQIATLARGARGSDPYGLQAEFANLVELAGTLGTPAVR